MAEIDLSKPDRHIGSMLGGEEVERLRDAIGWLREHRGFRLNEIALECDIPEHTVRNFAYRKSNRPDGAVLGKLYKYFVGNGELLPEGFFAPGREPASESPDGFLGRIARFDLIKRELPISESDLKRVYDRYSGHYICFRRSYRPEAISVSWLHILPFKPSTKITRWGLPLPRFTLFNEYPDQFDPDTMRSYVVIGYAFSRGDRIYLTGQHDGNLHHFILNEPPIPKYTYIQGLYLATSSEDKRPFAAQVVCQYLGSDVSRHDWSDKLGILPRDEFDTRFENADIILRAIGGNDLLVARNDNA
ncbi:MAG: hypothetical protein O7D29_04850 [Gemmatimonadetes bacterium]|nr:hypothetical protein [Gemmatimonadota bacterium]